MKPEDYYEDARGNLVHKDNVKPVDALRDQLVLGIIQEGRKAEEAVAAFKRNALEGIEAFRELSAERFGVVLGGKRGNVTLTSYNGRYRVVCARQDQPEFNEALDVARQLIRECLDEWTQGSRDEVRLIIDQAFDKGKSGNVSISKVMGLRQLKIDHPKWLKAMEAIGESISVVATKTYIRIYRRRADGEYQLIPLDGNGQIQEDAAPASVPEPIKENPKLRALVDDITARQKGAAA